MNLQLTGQFFAVALMLTMTPGPDWAYAIASGVRRGRFLPAITGMLSGHLLVIVLVAVGLGALITGHPVALEVLTAVGACYLLWLGAKTLLGLRRTEDPNVAKQHEGGAFARGFAVSSLNPKGQLLLIALLPQFVTAGGWALQLQLLLLGIVFLTSCAIVYPAVAFGARTLLAARPQAAQLVTVFSGAIMMLLGAGLIYDALSG